MIPKKHLIKLLPLVAILLSTSCKKEYSCNCTTEDGFFDITYVLETKKDEATSWCNEKEQLGEGIDGWSCNLK